MQGRLVVKSPRPWTSGPVFKSQPCSYMLTLLITALLSVRRLPLDRLGILTLVLLLPSTIGIGDALIITVAALA